MTKVMFEPIKMVFHDVADGKTLKFWDMYYRYYFADGFEAKKNAPVQIQQKNATTATEFLKNITPSLNPSIANLPASVKNLFQSNSPTGADSATNTTGDKSASRILFRYIR